MLEVFAGYLDLKDTADLHCAARRGHRLMRRRWVA